MTLEKFGRLCRYVGLAFAASNPSRLAAAMSFYAICSFPPLTILAMLVVGSYTHDPVSVRQLTEPLRELLGGQNTRALEDLLLQMGDSVLSTRATVFGFLGLLFSASGVFAEVQSALNTIWQAPAESLTWRSWVRQRLLTFLVLFGSGLILMSSMLLFTWLTVLSNYFSSRIALPVDALRFMHGGVSVVLMTLLFGGLYWILPEVQMHWGDVLLGAIVTSVLFTAGKATMGWYLGRFGVSSIYGPVSSLVALLFWVYYSTQIFLFGAHFTYVYACQYGSLAPLPGSNLPPLKPKPRKRKLPRLKPPRSRLPWVKKSVPGERPSDP